MSNGDPIHDKSTRKANLSSSGGNTNRADSLLGAPAKSYWLLSLNYIDGFLSCTTDSDWFLVATDSDRVPDTDNVDSILRLWGLNRGL